MVNENIIPKTETVYELKERNYEIKTSKLSLAARSKIIKRYGSDYLSERAFAHDIALMEMYGPGIWEDIGGFAIKTVATTVAAGAIIATGGTAAPFIGAGMWAGGKVAEEIGKETDCQLLRSIGSFTKDTGFGAVAGLAFSDAKFISELASVGIDANKLSKIKDLAEPTLAIKKHTAHKNRGISYDRDCEVCNL